MINEELVENNILNLKIISKIKENDKLSSQKEIIKIDPPTLLQGVYRWINSEGREITLEKLTVIVESTMKITEELLDKERDKNDTNYIDFKENNSEILQNYIIEMTNSLLGLENLKKTYNNDISIASKIDLLLRKINTRNEKMSKLFSINI